MNEQISNIFSRQYKRMENELIGLNIPMGYLSIISKYWRFAEEDLENLSKENGDAREADK